jgi:transposase
MPWRDTSPMDQRTQFIADHLRDTLSITELCALYGISRKTGYKWIDRYVRHGPAALEEQSRRPRRSPNQTSEEIVRAVLDARRRHPYWGGKKLLALLHARHPRWSLPGRSTACDILKRHGLVPLRRQRRRIGHPGKPTSQMLAPNDVWSADYKGQFRTGDGRYCYPLTVADGFSRFLLGWPRPRAPRRAASRPSSAGSMSFERSSITSGRTRRSIKCRRPRATRHRLDPCPTGCRRSYTPIASKSATSAPTGASGGIADGSTCLPSASANTWALRRLPTGSGTSTLGR